jgi:uncharacterized protein YecE (DUF72 family)
VIHVGTSGWQYGHWRARFYPQGVPTARWLEHYAARFATVEVNNTFYRLPAAKTFAAWASRVPPDFVVAVKASRYLTHYRRLRDPEEPVALLFERARPLGERLGPVLLQLPPDLRAAPDRLDATLRACAAARPGVRVAVEARHESWFTDEVRQVLRAHDAALCLADRRSRPVTPVWRTAGWTYVRLHEGAARPHPCYGERSLARWVERVRELGVDAYVYFNNDGRGCAVRDAVRFARRARRAGLEVTRTPPDAEAPVTASRG